MIEENKGEITIKLKFLNLNNCKFGLLRGGINIIVGENNTGKTKLLNYIFNNNEEWDKFNEKYKSGGFKNLPIFFRSFGESFPIYDPKNQHFSKKEKGKLKCSYELYYFDLKSSFPFFIKEEKDIVDKGIEFKNIKRRDCVFYYTEDNLEKSTGTLKGAIMRQVEETKITEPLILKYEDKERNFVLDVDHGVRGYNPWMGVTHPWLDSGSGLLKFNSLKYLISQILKKFKSNNTKMDKTAPFPYPEAEIYVPILLIEEPELLLHNSLIVDVVNLIKELSDNNITTIMTTHSSSFLSHFIYSDKLNLTVMKRDKDRKLLSPLNFWKLVEKEKNKSKVIDEYKEFARPNEEEIDKDEKFYRSKWKRLLNEYTLKAFFSKNVLFVEGMTEYILFNSILRERLDKDLDDIEIIPIFSKFNYIFFDELAKLLDLNYWFLLDDDRSIDKDGNTKWPDIQKKFWEKYGENETSEKTNGIIHSKENSERRISWLSCNTEEFLGIELDHYKEIRNCCKEYNLIRKAHIVLDNVKEKPEKLEELKKLLSFAKKKKIELN